MKQGRGIITIVLLVALGIALWMLLGRVVWGDHDLELRISGDPAIEASGTIMTEDTTLNVGLSRGSNVYRATGREFSWVITNLSDARPMTVEVFVDGESKGRITAGGDFSVVRGRLEGGEVTQATEVAARE